MSATRHKRRSVKSQSGFLLVTAIFLLVILAALGAFILTISGTQQTSSALDVQGSRAYQAARAGIDWASYQLLISAGAGPTFRSAASNGRTSTGNLTINKPAGTVQNDVMVAGIGFRTNSPGSPVEHSTDIGITPPAGWTLVPSGRIDNPNQSSSGLTVYYKVAGAGEPASYTWAFACINVSGGDTCNTLGFNAATGGILSFSNVDTTTPIDVENGRFATSNSYNLSTPSVTTTVANDMLVTTHGEPNADTWDSTPSSGMTQAFQITTNSEMVQMSYALQAAVGATGTKTTTDQGPDSSDMGDAHILALRPGGLSTFATNCSPGPTSQNVTGMGGTLSGFTASVTCSSTTYTEGGSTWTVYQITSTGAQGTAGTLDRVERQLQVTLIK